MSQLDDQLAREFAQTQKDKDPRKMDGEARAAGRLAVSGASTLPALSSAVVDEVAPRFERLEEIEISIAPGQRAPRGPATLAAVFSYAGRRIRWLSGGTWREANDAVSVADLSEAFHRRFRVWFALGVPAFAAVLAIYWLMVAKPLAVG